MKINVKELKNGDVFKIQGDNKTYKVMEVSEIPLYTAFGEVVYPIMCDCFSPEHGKTCGYMKISDGVKEVELLYRDNENKYESLTSAIFKDGEKEDEN